MSAIILQPVSVAVEADQAAVQSYSGGIVSSDCGTYLDHGILDVGYDSAAGYYLVVNSWGARIFGPDAVHSYLSAGKGFKGR